MKNTICSRRRGLIALALLIVVGCVGTWALWPDDRALRDWTQRYSSEPPASATADDQPADDYDTTPRPADLMPAGIVVGDGPPAGYSHLVFKSLPRVNPDQAGQLPGLFVRYASFLFTVVVADVERLDSHPPRHRLRTAALGLGTLVEGRHVVLTPDEASKHGAKLGFIERQILAAGQERMSKSMTIVQGETFLLMDTPVHFRCGARHRLVTYRYAFLADRATGELVTLLWIVDPAGTCELDPANRRVVWMSPNKVHDAILHVDRGEFKLGVPTEAAYAVEALPTGQATLDLPESLRPLAMQVQFTPQQAGQLERQLRSLLSTVRQPKP
jgi:hypothetical protein